MTLATSSADGAPSARVVLLKGVDRGFVFFTNYRSRKGRELEANPRAALVFHWQPLGRQVRVEGTVERATLEESATYFASRPRGARIGAWASPQSESIPTRAHLEERLAAAAAEHEGDEIPLPPAWGGYRLVPTSFEFWQHGDDRLHDRFRVRAGRGRLAHHAARPVEPPGQPCTSPRAPNGQSRCLAPNVKEPGQGCNGSPRARAPADVRGQVPLRPTRALSCREETECRGAKPHHDDGRPR